MKKVNKYILLSASLLVGTAGAINANLPAIAAHFSDIPLTMVEMLTTVPSLFLMISVFVSSMVARKFGYKQTISIGLIIVSIAGITPLIIDNFYIILISRAMLGLGIGLFNSLLVSMINYFYKGETTKLFGLQSSFEGIGGIIITFIAGQLLKINWQIPFIAYVIAIPITIIYIIGVPQVETKAVLAANTILIKAKDRNEIVEKPLKYWMYLSVMFCVAMLYMSYGIKISSLLTVQGYGSASDASIVIIALSLGGITAGLLFKKIIEIFNEATGILGLLILSLAMYGMSISSSVLLTVVCGYLSGVGFKMFMPYLINKVNTGNYQNKSMKTSLLLVAFNLGVFASPYGSVMIMNIFGTASLPNLFLILAVGQLSLALILLYINKGV